MGEFPSADDISELFAARRRAARKRWARQFSYGYFLVFWGFVAVLVLINWLVGRGSE